LKYQANALILKRTEKPSSRRFGSGIIAHERPLADQHDVSIMKICISEISQDYYL
jgi:hypothetical protein